MKSTVLNIGEGGFTFAQLMEICGYLPEDSGIRAGVWRGAVKAATNFEEARMVYESKPKGDEFTIGILKMMVDTASTFEQAEEAYLDCCTSDYLDGKYMALAKMLKMATAYCELENVYAHASEGSLVEVEAKRRMDTFK